MKGLIKRLLREGLIKENQYDNYIVLDKKIVDRIREINPAINKELSSSVFGVSNIYAKGGAARLALLIYCELDNNGGLHGNDVIRDSDFVYLGSYDDYQKDYEKYRDYGVDYEGETFEKYFSRRDITLNEVLLSPTKLMFTRRAYRDAMKNVVNPSKGNDSRYGVDDRLAARMFLFAARYGYKPVDSFKFNCNNYNTFDFLVCLLKSYELGIQDKFFNLFKEYCDEFSSLSDWLAFLMINTGGFDYYGRENGLVNDLSSVSDSELKSELEKTVYPEYPELKKAVNKLNIDDESDYFKHYLTKYNRDIPKQKMRRSVNMALAESELKGKQIEANIIGRNRLCVKGKIGLSSIDNEIDEGFLSSKIGNGVDKFKESWGKFMDAANREKKETYEAAKILLRLLNPKTKSSVTDDEIKFLKSQSKDLLRIAAVGGLGVVSMAIPIALEKILNKYGKTIMPGETKIGDSEK
jgi:hypothetical protein